MRILTKKRTYKTHTHTKTIYQHTIDTQSTKQKEFHAE